MCLHGPLATRTGRIEVRRSVSGVVALVLAVAALPPLAARAIGGRPPNPGPILAALAPVAALPAIIAVVVAATATWWLALLLTLPAATLVAWQLPPPRRIGRGPAGGPRSGSGPGLEVVTLRVLTLNGQGGSADPAAVLRSLRQHRVDVLVVQELTAGTVRDLADARVADLLPFCHHDPRPGSAGVGLWTRWPLIPLPPVPGLAAAAPRASIDPAGGRPVTLTGVHPLAPVNGQEHQWWRELALLKSALADVSGPQVVAGDFNATRDHRPFRDLLAAGFLDCADAGRSRPWPGFTWPTDRRIPPVMRLDHVLVSRPGAAVLEARIVAVPGTDHRGVLAVIEFCPGGQFGSRPNLPPKQ
jgi:endonuclease/exonuclease/phosphatase (EEP) superfamily protein YafD